MEITRLTRLVGADAGRVEALVVQIEQRAPQDRADLLDELARALGFGEPSRSVDRPATGVARTDLADAAAMDLGFD